MAESDKLMLWAAKMVRKQLPWPRRLALWWKRLKQRGELIGSELPEAYKADAAREELSRERRERLRGAVNG